MTSPGKTRRTHSIPTGPQKMSSVQACTYAVHAIAAFAGIGPARPRHLPCLLFIEAGSELPRTRQRKAARPLKGTLQFYDVRRQVSWRLWKRLDTTCYSELVEWIGSKIYQKHQTMAFTPERMWVSSGCSLEPLLGIFMVILHGTHPPTNSTNSTLPLPMGVLCGARGGSRSPHHPPRSPHR